MIAGRATIGQAAAVIQLQAPKGRKPFDLTGEGLSSFESGGGHTTLEPWMERFRVEFCIAPPTGFDLAVLGMVVEAL
ncbi:MAG TPA: hypothetical protein VFF73_03085 [Planctomycetota bacterium]|nr:hypothetical protein [Planctomycetota bacterium]